MIHDQRGYLLFDVDPKACTVDLRAVDQVFTPGGNVSTLARYVVKPVRPEAIRACWPPAARRGRDFPLLATRPRPLPEHRSKGDPCLTPDSIPWTLLPSSKPYRTT